MPIHDWTRAPSGYFHHFHQRWSVSICDALNRGLLPKGFFALIDQREPAGTVPDVLTLERQVRPDERPEFRGGLAVAAAPPRARFVRRATDAEVYAARANRVVVRQARGEVVSVVEIVSPGNKGSAHALRSFVEKSADFLRRGIHLLVIDLFPPTPRDPQGIHKAIWDEVQDEPFELPADKRLTLASYVAGPDKTAYIEPVAVGELLPDMPAFLGSDFYVPVPLERAHEEAWASCPDEFRDSVGG